VRTVETLHKYCKIDDPDELEVSLSLDAQIWYDPTHWLLQRERKRSSKPPRRTDDKGSSSFPESAQ
jgi:hypothetical protein